MNLSALIRASLFAVITLCFVTPASVAKLRPELRGRISNLHAVPLKSGLNNVKFEDGNGTGQTAGKIIVLDNIYGSRDDYEVYIPVVDWGIVRVDYEPLNQTRLNRSSPEEVTDNPFEGSGGLREIKFFNANWDGQPATLLVIAERNYSKIRRDTAPTPVRITILKFTNGPDVLPTFDPVASFETSAKYCKATFAIAQVFGFALPREYTAPVASQECRGSDDF